MDLQTQDDVRRDMERTITRAGGSIAWTAGLTVSVCRAREGNEVGGEGDEMLGLAIGFGYVDCAQFEESAAE